MLQRTMMRDAKMNTILNWVDRAGLGLINLFVVAGLPLVAIGLVTNVL